MIKVIYLIIYLLITAIPGHIERYNRRGYAKVRHGNYNKEKAVVVADTTKAKMKREFRFSKASNYS
ncbi:hypothetical protein AM493_05790 [Flavobacterium akiainvivens]|uniref:Uncharacterized protein n=1 Tax=Flavobacterium akiainvivens TaxID=1202724 RepID=A0A0N0RQM0_9FLAO|nr:hypothetical protein AM493_05790 [Flavobacterium akiainvivens]SFQ35114.1 hypothetical protein SAMN05444144_103194 [Flavobacterium akiainvivens]